MVAEKAVVAREGIERAIYLIRGQRVMLDADLAELYDVSTRRLNEQVKRNKDRFPVDFMFQLTKREAESLKSQIATSKPGRGGRRTLPYAFTEHGAIMAATVLNSPRAVEMSVSVVRAFVRLREMAMTRKDLARRLAALERKMLEHDKQFAMVFEAIRGLMAEPKPKRKRIGFEPARKD
ncbi:MAG TPA: ORF6N domain-containing protein [Candidatus Hydrogenedentes bacterium]|nr:ORF6N domain-containing protein [Candidatus Hydrogenedentota bacterium]